MRTETDVNLIKTLDDTVVAAKLIVDVTIDEIDETVGLWSPYLNQQLRISMSRPQHVRNMPIGNGIEKSALSTESSPMLFAA